MVGLSYYWFRAMLMNLLALNDEDRAAYNAAQDVPEDDDFVTEPELMDINDVLDGTAELNFSHAGGEFQDIMEEELRQKTRYAFALSLHSYLPFNRHPRMDPRTRKNRTELRNQGFKVQLKGIVDAYITWQETVAEHGLDAAAPSVSEELLQGVYKIQVMDVFCKRVRTYRSFHLLTGLSYILSRCRIS